MSDWNMNQPVLLFDGVCNLCNGAVQFIIRNDKQQQFHFASLQSDIGQEFLKRFNLPEKALDTVVLIDQGKAYTRSSAALHTLKKMGGLWLLLYAFIVIPSPIRDAVYNWIAKNRYKWFGRQDSCMIPTPDLRARFLDN